MIVWMVFEYFVLCEFVVVVDVKFYVEVELDDKYYVLMSILGFFLDELLVLIVLWD